MGEKYVIDATMGARGDMFCFCPVELDEDGEIVSIVTGLNYISQKPPRDGKLIAIVHEDGQDAVEAFCEQHADLLAAISAPA